MYAQGNQNPQPGQGPQKPMTSPYQHCLPGPPPLPQFQQGPSSFTFFPHGPAAPRQIPPGGRFSGTGQFYPYLPLHVHAGTSLPHLYPAAQQNSQHNPHLGTQNAPNLPLSVLPPISTSHPKASLTKPPSRALPPPPPPPPPLPPQSQGPVFYRASVNPPLKRPGFQYLSSHPPFPATTSFFSSAPLGSFIHSTGINHHTAPLPPPPPPSLPLPPPPSSPLPIQPSPPSCTSISISSSKPSQNDSSLPCNLDNDGSKLSPSGSMDEAGTPNPASPNLIAGDDSLNKGGGNACNMGFMVGDKLPLEKDLTVDVSYPPYKPTDKNVIERIKALCLCIAKNGPDYEDVVRKNEHCNPEYSFLYVSEPGSEDAVAHDFFQWMKKKSILTCKLEEQQYDSCFRPSENVPLEQHCPLVIAAASHSPGDSDMDMEDDITQIEDQRMNHTFKGLNCQCDINNNMLTVEEQIHFHPVQMLTDVNANKDILSEKESAVGSSRLDKDPEGIANTGQMAFSASVSKINSVKSTVPTKQPLVMSLEKSNSPSQLAKSDCLFRLIQDYASDDNLENVEVGSSADSDKLQKESMLENENFTLGSQHKLDKFGRLIRDGASDSDSDGIGSYRRGKPRSRNQSHSPLDRRRSSQRTRKKHSLSRSWSPRNRRSRSRSPRNRRSRSGFPRDRRSRGRSPRNQRSRSRSPRNQRSRGRSPRNQRSRSRSPRNRRSRSRSLSFHHTDEFSGEKNRRVKGQMPFCFDFRRGKCYRGVSCRYLHHDSGKSFESRWQSSKQYLELPHTSRNNNAREEIKQSFEKREDSGDGGVHYQDIQSNEYHMVKSDRSRDIPASLFETRLLEKQEGPIPVSHENCQEAAAESQHLSTIDSSSVGNMDTLKSCANASQKVTTSFYGPLDPVCQNANSQPQQSDNSSMSDSLPCKTSPSSLNRHPESNVHPHAMELHNHPGHISSPSVLCSHGKDNPHMKEQQTSSSMFQSSGECFPSYMLPSQEAYLALQPSSSVTSLPPPPPPPPSLDSTVTPSVSSHFQQNYFPLRNVFGSQVIPRPYLTELPACFQSDGVQHRAYPPIRDVNQPILQASLPVCNLPVVPSISRDDGLTQPPKPNVIASNSLSQCNIHLHTLPCSQQLLGNEVQRFSSESLPPGGLNYSSSYIHPFAQQQPPHSSHHPTIDGFYNLGGRMNSCLKVPPNVGDTSSYRVDIGESSSSIPDPNASTFVQPMNTKHNSDILRQEKDIAYNKTPFSMAHDPVHGRVIGSQQATLSPNSSRTFRQNFLGTGGDQYDPLFDSIEPSSSLSRKNSCTQKLEVTGDSDILLGLSGSNKPLNMGENNQRKDAAAAASVASAGNEEFGETADGEVGAVESGSPSNPVEVNMGTSEIEIDQIKSPGKSKKHKDSRSMKHFKVALARFVKDLLKPSWRQGNMSNEVFKTIVKKTIDKVSGAMKNHHIPKSRAKIDRYIESSQQKLTKLVTGYVNKYVNV